MTRAKRKARKPIDHIEPTRERSSRNIMERAGMAYRAKAPIRELFDRDKITPAQFDALCYYRQQAQQAEDDSATMSPMHPDKAMGGGGGSVSGSTIPAQLLRATPAQIETSRIERDILGYGQWALDLLRHVARDDKTLCSWCIETHGGRERYDGKGRLVAIVPVAERRVMREALLSLKYIAGAIVK